MLSFLLILVVSFIGKGHPEPEVAAEVIKLTNAYRTSHERPAFTENEFLNELALEHSKNMAEKKTGFGHGGFNKRAKKAGKEFILKGFAENVFYCDDECSAELAVEGWLGSKGHLKNIRGDYSHIGVGVYTNNKGERYFTQVFAQIEE